MKLNSTGKILKVSERSYIVTLIYRHTVLESANATVGSSQNSFYKNNAIS